MSVGTNRIIGNAGPLIDLKAWIPGDLAETNAPLMVSNIGWTYGTSANQVNIIYADTIVIADGGNTTLDLNASGTLLDIFGRALTLDAIKFLYVKNRSTDSGLTIGGGVALDLDLWSDTSDKQIIPSGGIYVWADPSAAGVDCSVNKNLYMVDDGTGAAGNKNFDVIAMGLD
jgi:hypothetical protein